MLKKKRSLLPPRLSFERPRSELLPARGSGLPSTSQDVWSWKEELAVDTCIVGNRENEERRVRRERGRKRREEKRRMEEDQRRVGFSSEEMLGFRSSFSYQSVTRGSSELQIRCFLHFLPFPTRGETTRREKKSTKAENGSSVRRSVPSPDRGHSISFDTAPGTGEYLLGIEKASCCCLGGWGNEREEENRGL